MTSQLIFCLKYITAGQKEAFFVSAIYNRSELKIQHSLFTVYQITKTKSINNVFSDIQRFFFSWGSNRKQETSQNTPLE